MSTSDRITEHEDWKDGMNAFRLRVLEEMTRLEEEINKIKQHIKGETP